MHGLRVGRVGSGASVPASEVVICYPIPVGNATVKVGSYGVDAVLKDVLSSSS